MDLKPPRLYKEQLQIIKDRGCIINDESECIAVLESVNYYRLSAYFLPFKNENNASPIGYTLSKNFYRCTDDEKHIQKKKKFHEKFIESLNREIKKNEKVLFVKHHINKYKGNFPIWVASEIFTFGMLSIFFSNLKLEDKKVLSRDIYNTFPKNMESTAIPAGIKHIDEKSNRRLWGAVFAIKKLYPFKYKWNNEILKKLMYIVEEHKEYIDLEHIAFPNNWNTLLIKQ